ERQDHQRRRQGRYPVPIGFGLACCSRGVHRCFGQLCL
ncbi:hypothetical protein, partial [Sideroxydans sp. CL21]